MYHIAELNIARMRAPIDDPLMQDFVDWLDPVNGLADESEGFVWRLQTDVGVANVADACEDELLLVNLSVWETIEHLREYVMHPNHMQVMRQSLRWFEPMDGPHLVLWWVPAGDLPSEDQAMKKLEFLAAHGPSAEAFTFSQVFPPPE